MTRSRWALPFRACAPLAALALAPVAPSLARDASPRPAGPDDLAACYSDTLMPAELQQAMARWGLLPPGRFLPGADFFLDALAWHGEGDLVENGLAERAILTFSIVPDGTAWGSLNYVRGPSDLREQLLGAFGLGNEDLGLEYVRAAVAAYRVAGLTLREAPDDGAPWGTPDPPGPDRGHIRVGGLPMGAIFLGYSSFPSGGADVAINTAIFNTGNLGSGAQAYRYLRNTVAHEIGHALGLSHSVPCDDSKLMEPVLATACDMLAIDDLRGVQRDYGDRFAGDTTPEQGVDLGDLSLPAPRTIRLENLSTNGSGQNVTFTDRDWFRFSLASAQTVHIGIDPTGGMYSAGRQEINCDLTNVGPIDAQHAGTLTLELRDETGATLIASGAAAAGMPQRIDRLLAPGQYTIRVIDGGPTPPANLRVQLYDLFASAGESPTPPPPLVIAGVGKRAPANKYCFFLGDINSHAVAGGGELSLASFDWDLDGDGTFETTSAPRPARLYFSNGVYPVTLRVTDSNGQSAADTIPVTIFGAVTTVSFAFPTDYRQHATTPITIYGTNFKNIQQASEVEISGFGVHVEGAPVSNPDGTTLTGLSIRVDPGAELGLRSVFVRNDDGFGFGTDMVRITPSEFCAGDVNGDHVVNTSDLSATLGLFGQSGAGLPADFNGDGRVDFTDLNTVLSNFGLHC